VQVLNYNNISKNSMKGKGKELEYEALEAIHDSKELED
jgi:hypothetical protein